MHGQWSAWGEWSPDCTQYMDESGIGKQMWQKSRKRSCDNPQPIYGGDICLGLDEEKEICTPGKKDYLAMHRAKSKFFKFMVSGLIGKLGHLVMAQQGKE